MSGNGYENESQTGVITMQLGDFLNKGITDCGITSPHKAVFTIWDSTSGTVAGTNSQYATVNVYMAVSLPFTIIS